MNGTFLHTPSNIFYQQQQQQTSKLHRTPQQFTPTKAFTNLLLTDEQSIHLTQECNDWESMSCQIFKEQDKEREDVNNVLQNDVNNVLENDVNNVLENDEEEDERHNANLDIVGQRCNFQEGERLIFIASQRIHYYKMDDFKDILNERSDAYNQHCENLRNIIMTMSNNYGGLVMFGLGKNKVVEGVLLSAQEKQDFIKFITTIKNSIHQCKYLYCKVEYFPVYRLIDLKNDDSVESQHYFNHNQNAQSQLNKEPSYFKLFDSLPQVGFSLFKDDIDEGATMMIYPHQDDMFNPFLRQFDQGQIGNEQQIWQYTTCDSTSEEKKKKKNKKEWITDRYVVRMFVEQGQKYDITYVTMKDKEMTSAIYDKKLKIFKPIYGEPLFNKIIQKAQNPSLQGQKLSLVEPNKDGIEMTQSNEMESHTSGQIMKNERKRWRVDVSGRDKVGLVCRSEEYLVECTNVVSIPLLTQEYLKRKRGEKILNDTKKRQIKEKHQRYQQEEEKNQVRKSQSHMSSYVSFKSHQHCKQESHTNQIHLVLPVAVMEDVCNQCVCIQLIGFEHSDNAKEFQGEIERQVGLCVVDFGVTKYDTLFFQLSSCRDNQERIRENKKTLDCSEQKGLALSIVEEQDWMGKLCGYLLMNENWMNLVSKEKIFKKMMIDERVYCTSESEEWMCFQNVKDKKSFALVMSGLEGKNQVERVNFYHQYVFKVVKNVEFLKFCQTNESFGQCFLADTVKKGCSQGKIILKNVKNSRKAQEIVQNLLKNLSFTISDEGDNFFVCAFTSSLESFIAMERLINHRKQKLILDLFTTNSLDAHILLVDKNISSV